MIRSLSIIALLSTSAAFAQPAPGDAPPASPPDMITRAQFEAEQVTRVMAADSDGDGRVSKAEWAAHAPARPPSLGGMGGRGTPADARERRFDPAAMFDRLDANGDGFVDRSEALAAADRRFDRMDANGDGVVTPDERPQRGRGPE